MLTAKQRELLGFIKTFMRKHLRSPTHREMKRELNVNSNSYLNKSIDKLESLKFIRRKAKGFRYNIELLNSPYCLPIIGRIAAGSPIDVIGQLEGEICVLQLLGEDRYLLRVKGNSMIEENICDGDLVICERCQRVPNGTIIVALINKQEATLKRIYYEKDKIHLKPANKDCEVQVYDLEEVEIQGKFVGLIRLRK
jgi:repressor LexA